MLIVEAAVIVGACGLLVLILLLHQCRHRPTVVVREELELDRLTVRVLVQRRELRLAASAPALPLDHQDFVLGVVPAVDGASEGGLILAGGPLHAEECALDAEADVLNGRLAFQDVDDLFEALRGLTPKVSSIPASGAVYGLRICAAARTWLGIVTDR